MLSSFGAGDAGARLIDLCREVLGDRRLILVSNRGPVEYRIAEDGTLRAGRSGGGVVTTLTAVGQYVELTWIAAAMGEGDRQAMEQVPDGRLQVALPGQRLSLRFVAFPRSIYHKYYNIYCNPLLWFLQHYMWTSSHAPNIDAKVYDAWENGYVPVNKTFAEAAVTEAAEDAVPPLIMLHDYQLYLVGGFIRSQMPDAIIQHFIHIPWPDPSYWQLFPGHMRSAILESLCSVDIVGLQTSRDVRNFINSCDVLLKDAEVDYQEHTVYLRGHKTRVVAYPVSVDVGNLERISRWLRVRGFEEKLRPHFGRRTIVRVDRAEPSKNIIRGLKAFDVLLERYPELRGEVKLLSFLVPSRTGIKQYQRYTQEVFAMVEAINTKYGDEQWQPIKVFYENNYPQAIAAMKQYDVLLVNSVIDGMNLVAKEGPVINQRDGVLILSEAVGAYEQLKEYAISVAPADLEGTTEALHNALLMDPEEKKRRAEGLRAAIRAEDANAWLHGQFEDLKKLTQERVAEAT